MVYMKYPKFYFTVTPFSKNLALVLFFLMPILAFLFGIYVGQALLLREMVQSMDKQTIIQNIPSIKW